MESSPDLFPAVPVRPAAAYIGGKRLLADAVIKRLQAISHAAYVEPFVGMGGVFLRRPFRARQEVINDISADVTTLFRILQHHYVAFMDFLKWQITSRDEFERLKAANPDTLTDLQRAARFLYLQRTAFGGKVSGRNFGVSHGTGARFDVTKLGAILEEVHDRLAGVVIERLPWQQLLRRYDRPGTLFYLDPPYWGNETDYGEGVFAPGDFVEMAKLLGGLQGQFVLSLNDVPGVRRAFKAFQIEAVRTSYSISKGAGQAASEVLISRLLGAS